MQAVARAVEAGSFTRDAETLRLSKTRVTRLLPACPATRSLSEAPSTTGATAAATRRSTTWGGRIGGFEGNGGDLRIELPQQSLHDGQTLRHTPLRPSVFIDAPRWTIDSVIGQHHTVANLVRNGWPHLLRIATDEPQVERWQAHAWAPAVAGDSLQATHRSDRAAA